MPSSRVEIVCRGCGRPFTIASDLAPHVKLCSVACLTEVRARADREKKLAALIDRNRARDAIERGLACAVRRRSDAGV